MSETTDPFGETFRLPDPEPIGPVTGGLITPQNPTGGLRPAAASVAMTAPDARALLDELEKLRGEATPGPWWAWDRGVGWHIVTEDPATVGRGSVPVTLPEGLRTDLARGADAALIVAAVNALPELVAAVRAVTELADALRIDAAETARESESDDLNPEEGERLAGKAQGLEEAADALTAALTPERTTP